MRRSMSRWSVRRAGVLLTQVVVEWVACDRKEKTSRWSAGTSPHSSPTSLVPPPEHSSTQRPLWAVVGFPRRTTMCRRPRWLTRDRPPLGFLASRLPPELSRQQQNCSPAAQWSFVFTRETTPSPVATWQDSSFHSLFSLVILITFPLALASLLFHHFHRTFLLVSPFDLNFRELALFSFPVPVSFSRV